MRQIVERVTCDKCGRVVDFEKLNNYLLIYRLESLTDWLLQLGWTIQERVGSRFRPVDYCPDCVPASTGRRQVLDTLR